MSDSQPNRATEPIDADVETAWPKPCHACGQAWDRIGHMEWELICSCPPSEDQTWQPGPPTSPNAHFAVRPASA